MKKLLALKGPILASLLFSAACLTACKQDSGPADKRIKRMDTTLTAHLADSITSIVKPELAEGLSLSLWGIDSLVISPIGIDIDDQGRVYYTTTDRQKHSEFDIRGHRDWEIPSISLQTVEDRRAFLHKELSPENSKRNLWLEDLNGDSSHDWRDLAIEKEHVYRLDDITGDGVADQSQMVVDDFHDEVTDVAGGVLSDGDDLYLAVAPDLWRIRDKNHDGIADEKTSISHGYAVHVGFSGHGMSGVEMGPDGRIYWQIGDIGFNGKGPDGKEWSFPNCGVLARSNPDGSDFEIYSYGIRNTHEFAFDEYGNIISEDNDGDHPGEKERLVYLVNGGDQGWRSNWQYGKYNDPDNNTYKVWMDEKMYLPRFEGQAAYITPCISNFVSGPAGFVYNPGTALGPAYKNTFFVAEFVGNPSNSGVHAFKLNPKGATFELGEHKKVLGGILATGIDFGPDGALYVADWIDGWDTHNYGRIWKLDDKKDAASAERKLTKALLAEDFSKRKEADLAGLLNNPDMRVRMKAQFELVKRKEKGAPLFEQALKQTDNQLARVHGIWGLSQLARQDKQYAKALLPLLKDNDPEIRAQAAKWLGDIRYKEAGAALVPLLKDTASRARFFAAEALGRIAYAPAVQPLIAYLEANNDVDAYQRHAGTLALSRIGEAAPLIALANNPSRALRIAAVVTLRRMSHPGIAAFLNDKDEFVVTETARAINDDLSIKDALPALAKLLVTTSFKNEALIRRAINANLRVGTDSALNNLLSYAQKAGSPAPMRAEAIDALSVWAKPSVLDRVDGRLRGEIKRNAAPVVHLSTSPLTALLKDKELPVRISAARAIAKLQIKQAGTSLLAAVQADHDADMRVAALEALVALQDAGMEQGITAALTDKEKAVRVAGLDLLGKMHISENVMVKLLMGVIANKTVEEKQAALLTLGKLPQQYVEKPLSELLDKMAAGQLDKGIYLELGEAIDSSRSSALATRYKTINSKVSPDDLMASYSSCLLGGDPKRGRQIFFHNQNSQCMRCHSYDDRGGNAGPRLNGVAGRITREQILQALITPSARLAPGFGMVTLELKDGKKLTGILQGETKTALKIKEGQEERTIAADQIVNKKYAESSMPDMKLLLSKKEIRDVVSFLAEQKTDN
ncbi:HEAT repeat domain-containing protein [Chitinophaga pinensis]|uniref:Heme-binding protein n=1 Tax=Chitinophaga pinensis (strain ATCC 43595 / DSM 2588 / LMG 13176 / NBRC 15968 / NCIMB 11800 / UQM 2034) TaxID=485918 RepID=A0A979G3L7_CHIPD|nr:HEAT repeat domain-containing protein [Chitinophaga pinensis]ACU59953.1 heme-binding protein [Chitinophaga pinensis DSM 2588]